MYAQTPAVFAKDRDMVAAWLGLARAEVDAALDAAGRVRGSDDKLPLGIVLEYKLKGPNLRFAHTGFFLKPNMLGLLDELGAAGSALVLTLPGPPGGGASAGAGGAGGAAAAECYYYGFHPLLLRNALAAKSILDGVRSLARSSHLSLHRIAAAMATQPPERGWPESVSDACLRSSFCLLPHRHTPPCCQKMSDQVGVDPAVALGAPLAGDLLPPEFAAANGCSAWRATAEEFALAVRAELDCATAAELLHEFARSPEPAALPSRAAATLFALPRPPLAQPSPLPAPLLGNMRNSAGDGGLLGGLWRALDRAFVKREALFDARTALALTGAVAATLAALAALAPPPLRLKAIRGVNVPTNAPNDRLSALANLCAVELCEHAAPGGADSPYAARLTVDDTLAHGV